MRALRAFTFEASAALAAAAFWALLLSAFTGCGLMPAPVEPPTRPAPLPPTNPGPVEPGPLGPETIVKGVFQGMTLEQVEGVLGRGVNVPESAGDSDAWYFPQADQAFVYFRSGKVELAGLAEVVDVE